MSFNLDSATILYRLYNFGNGLGTVIVLLIVRLLELNLDTFERHVDGLAHVFFVSGSNHLGASNVHGTSWSRITEALVIFG